MLINGRWAGHGSQPRSKPWWGRDWARLMETGVSVLWIMPQSRSSPEFTSSTIVYSCLPGSHMISSVRRSLIRLRCIPRCLVESRDLTLPFVAPDLMPPQHHESVGVYSSGVCCMHTTPAGPPQLTNLRPLFSRIYFYSVVPLSIHQSCMHAGGRTGWPLPDIGA